MLGLTAEIEGIFSASTKDGNLTTQGEEQKDSTIRPYQIHDWSSWPNKTPSGGKVHSSTSHYMTAQPDLPKRNLFDSTSSHGNGGNASNKA